MNKGDLINAVAESAGLTKDQATSAVASVFESVEKSLKGGEKCQFAGFGTFQVQHRAARDGRNPATGATIRIAAKNNVKFKAGKSLVEAMN